MSSIASGLFYLRATSIRNLLVSRFKRLRQPKYLIGAVVGVAYLYFAVFQRLGGTRRGRIANLATAFPPELLPIIVAFGAICVFAFIALCWLWSRERAALTFSEPEIAFLFPAPVRRKSLVHYRLISSQLGLLFTSLIFALLSSSWSFVTGGAVIRILGWWVLFTTISLHITGSAFTMTKWLDGGFTERRRQLGAFGVLIAILGVSYLTSWRSWPPPSDRDLEGFMSIVTYGSNMLSDGLFGIVLLPFKWIVRPLMSPDLESFLAALGPALLVFAVHYAWVLYTEASFEEASIAKAQRRAARVAAVRSGNVRFGRSAPKARRTPFNVTATPRVELAFLWKNLLSSAEYLRLRTALITAFVIVVGSLWLKQSDYQAIRIVVGGGALIFAAYSLVFAPLIARQDLRSDLLNTDILKTYPLRGWQIVLGEMLAPITIITVLMWLLLLAAALNFESTRIDWISQDLRIWGSVGVALVIPLLTAIQVLILNAGVVLFPAWMQIGQSRGGGGLDVMGQRILFLVGLIIAIVVALLPASIAGSIVFYATQWFIGPILAAALGLVVVLGILGAEIAIGVQVVGRQFEKFDLSAELRP